MDKSLIPSLETDSKQQSLVEEIMAYKPEYGLAGRTFTTDYLHRGHVPGSFFFFAHTSAVFAHHPTCLLPLTHPNKIQVAGWLF